MGSAIDALIIVLWLSAGASISVCEHPAAIAASAATYINSFFINWFILDCCCAKDTGRNFQNKLGKKKKQRGSRLRVGAFVLESVVDGLSAALWGAEGAAPHLVVLISKPSPGPGGLPGPARLCCISYCVSKCYLRGLSGLSLNDELVLSLAAD